MESDVKLKTLTFAEPSFGGAIGQVSCTLTNEQQSLIFEKNMNSPSIDK